MLGMNAVDERLRRGPGAIELVEPLSIQRSTSCLRSQRMLTIVYVAQDSERPVDSRLRQRPAKALEREEPRLITSRRTMAGALMQARASTSRVRNPHYR
jgi:hypothetical protein